MSATPTTALDPRDPAAVEHNPRCDCASQCILCDAVICPECLDTRANYVRGEPHCDDCLPKVLHCHAGEIATFVAQVRITRALTMYDPNCHHAPSRSEYEEGDRWAHTKNSVRTQNRHRATNYDALISALDRDDALDQAFYSAVRTRVDELLDAEVDELLAAEVDELLDDGVDELLDDGELGIVTDATGGAR